MKILVLVPPSKFVKNVPRDLVYGCWCKGKRIAGIQFPPLTSVIVATVLQDDGHDVTFLDAAGGYKTLEYVKGVAKEKDVVILLTSTMTVNEDAEVLAQLKSVNPKLISIVFGSHPTFLPEETLTKKGIDIAVRRESEYIIRDLVRAFTKNDNSWKKVPGIAFREGTTSVVNPDYPLIENLDALPFPDRAMLDPSVEYFNPIIKRAPFTTIYTTRGCPGKCTFCSSPSFYGRKIRFRSAKSILEELRIIKKMGYREVFFRDEFFPVSKERTRELCEAMISEKMDLTWICSARVGTIDEETMRLMKKAGCHMIRFGAESGVQKILDNVKKEIQVDATRATFASANRVGLSTHAHMMIAMPGETKETIEQSIQFAKEINPTVVTFGVMTPYPGTEVYEEVRKAHPEIGDGSACDLSKLHTQGFFNEAFTSLSREEISQYIRKAYFQFYMRPSYIFSWLKRINSFEELRRVILAGLQVFSFVKGND
ncbi:MAG TPA: radical SAM protein [Candidatus Omnitrophota bacterium]|nr:radical SAM protein [Candidatus Omnitrophota bacterium]HQL41035.1 radical SAM protein [Candidatus Omnitrophota bacterium]